MKIEKAFKEIDTLELKANKILDKQMELYSSIDLGQYTKPVLVYIIKNCRDSLARIYLADYIRTKFGSIKAEVNK